MNLRYKQQQQYSTTTIALVDRWIISRSIEKVFLLLLLRRPRFKTVQTMCHLTMNTQTQMGEKEKRETQWPYIEPNSFCFYRRRRRRRTELEISFPCLATFVALAAAEAAATSVRLRWSICWPFNWNCSLRVDRTFGLLRAQTFECAGGRWQGEQENKKLEEKLKIKWNFFSFQSSVFFHSLIV